MLKMRLEVLEGLGYALTYEARGRVIALPCDLLQNVMQPSGWSDEVGGLKMLLLLSGAPGSGPSGVIGILLGTWHTKVAPYRTNDR